MKTVPSSLAMPCVTEASDKGTVWKLPGSVLVDYMWTTEGDTTMALVIFLHVGRCFLLMADVKASLVHDFMIGEKHQNARNILEVAMQPCQRGLSYILWGRMWHDTDV